MHHDLPEGLPCVDVLRVCRHVRLNPSEPQLEHVPLLGGVALNLDPFLHHVTICSGALPGPTLDALDARGLVNATSATDTCSNHPFMHHHLELVDHRQFALRTHFAEGLVSVGLRRSLIHSQDCLGVLVRRYVTEEEARHRIGDPMKGLLLVDTASRAIPHRCL